MFLNVNIALFDQFMFSNVNIADRYDAMFTFGNFATVRQGGQVRLDASSRYSKYWNLLVGKLRVTVKPSPGTELARTPRPSLSQSRLTR